MVIWQRFRHLFNPEQPEGVLRLGAEIMQALRELAARQQCSEVQLATELLAFAIAQRKTADENLERWRTLTPREQEVTALVCLNHTNRQIASLLVLSPETVKTHMRNILSKFDISSKEEMRQVLYEWDFSTWDDNNQR